jgi:hypothetical protein
MKLLVLLFNGGKYIIIVEKMINTFGYKSAIDW